MTTPYKNRTLQSFYHRAMNVWSRLKETQFRGWLVHGRFGWVEKKIKGGLSLRASDKSAWMTYQRMGSDVGKEIPDEVLRLIGRHTLHNESYLHYLLKDHETWDK